MSTAAHSKAYRERHPGRNAEIQARYRRSTKGLIAQARSDCKLSKLPKEQRESQD